MITQSIYPLFPNCPTFGFTAAADLHVTHVVRAGGYETSDRKWTQPLLSFTGTPLGNRPQRDIEELLRFWRAIGGTSTTFRFKDWTDYKSGWLDDDPTPTDQPLVLVTGSPGGYQLVKNYVEGTQINERKIIRPKGDTIRVANEVGAEQAASTWRVEEDTGLLIPGPGFVGVPTSWGGEFYVKCRFTATPVIEIVNHLIQSCTVSLIEKR